MKKQETSFVFPLQGIQLTCTREGLYTRFMDLDILTQAYGLARHGPKKQRAPCWWGGVKTFLDRDEESA